MITTKFHDDFTKGAVREHVANIAPLKREGSVAEVVDLVACLASGEAYFLTGTTIDINRGLAFS